MLENVTIFKAGPGHFMLLQCLVSLSWSWSAISRYPCKQRGIFELGIWLSRLKSLPCKHEDLSSVPSTLWWQKLVIPALGMQRQEAIGAQQPTILPYLVSSRLMRHPGLTTWWTEPEEWQQKLPSDLSHARTHIHTMLRILTSRMKHNGVSEASYFWSMLSERALVTTSWKG